ncbi:MAG: ubiquitin-conjugating enzyme E2 [bacterium]
MTILKNIIYASLFLTNITNFNLFGMSRVLVRFASAPVASAPVASAPGRSTRDFFNPTSGTDYSDEDGEYFTQVRGLYDKLKVFFNNEGSNIELLSSELTDQAVWSVKMNFDSLEILLELTFPLTFPIEPPFVRVVSPVLLPCRCISEHGTVCCPLLTPLAWNMGAKFEKVLQELFDILRLNELKIDLYTDNIYSGRGALSDFETYLKSIGF